MDNATTLVSRSIERSSSAFFDFRLKHGRVWFSSPDTDSSLRFTLSTSHLRVQGGDAIFSLEDFSSQKGSEILRVFRGEVTVTVLLSDASGQREVETYRIAAGHEFNMDLKAYQAYEKYQSPEVVFPLGKDFPESEWYLWNDALDEKTSISS
jgi:hypothetical protein